MTKIGQTTNYGLAQHIAEIKRYLGKLPDVVLANETPLPKDLLAKYKAEGEFPVALDYNGSDINVITTDLLASEGVDPKSGDILKRSLIRHDSRKLARQIIELLYP